MTLRYRSCIATLAIVLASTLSEQAMANDRDLRATAVPPALWTGETEGHFDNAFGLVVGNIAPPGDDRFLSVRCALPLNNIDLGGTTNDNDMSSFTVFYRDADGRDLRVKLFVTLFEVRLSGGEMTATRKCSWNSSEGTGVTTFTSANVPCVVDLAATAFYHFAVDMQFDGTPNNFIEAAFSGIRFP